MDHVCDVSDTKNSVFILIPFAINEPHHTWELVNLLVSSEQWTMASIKNKFLYKYITQKLFDGQEKDKKCYILDFLEKQDEASEFTYSMIGKETRILPISTLGGQDCETYSFVIDKIRLILFASRIGIMAFNLHFLCNNPELSIISNSLYSMKKTSDSIFVNVEHSGGSISWLSLAESLFKTLSLKCKKHIELDFNFYSEKKYARANFFISTHTQVGNEIDLTRDLYYMKYGFSQRYDYVDDDIEGNYHAPNGRRWGISSEGCACLLTATDKRVINKQLSEFREEYFLMYCILLHQKYFYYKLLMQIGSMKSISANNLKKYKSNLITFETDYVFSTITEVPQYQGVYEKLFSRLQLSNLYADVYEPINNLNNDVSENNEKNISRMGFFVSLLGLFSILADGYFVISLFFENCVAIAFVILVSSLAMVLLSIFIVFKIVKWFRNR